MLPCKIKGKTILPTGSRIGRYFSDELKAVLSLGYNNKFIEGYEFSKNRIIYRLCQQFLWTKENSTGPAIFMAKMPLKALYGNFVENMIY